MFRTCHTKITISLQRTYNVQVICLILVTSMVQGGVSLIVAPVTSRGRRVTALKMYAAIRTPATQFHHRGWNNLMQSMITEIAAFMKQLLNNAASEILVAA